MDSQDIEREYRFLLSSHEARAFVDAASEHLMLDVHDGERPAAFTRTTYFDTPDLRYHRDEQAGFSRRVRVRQYASAVDPERAPRIVGPAYLEFKESVGLMRQKLRFAAPPWELRRLIGGERMADEVEHELSQLPLMHELASSIRMQTLAPVFSTWYRRVSLSNDRVRLTIDENVSFCLPFNIGLPGRRATPQTVTDILAGRILELKVTGEMPTWLRAALEPLAGTESPSKFRRGMRLMQTGCELEEQVRPSRPLAIGARIRGRDANL